ncbi:adenylate/guanylate cyclase domain-containing protein, partial [Klebsiella pneumoniae]|uniref:adenylate/guanylate cyclase domain-containing protein n=1 Tax=Klebsiella pneumoniae TaxID=573 RepID=UPI002006692A
RIQVRIGVNLGEVIVEGEDRYGEGVNIAARLEQLAEPGGIWVSAKVAREVEKKLAFGFEPMGAQKVKNIAEPVEAFRVKLDGLPAKPLVPAAARRAWAWAAVGLLIAGTAALLYAPGLGKWGQMAPALAARPGIAVLPFLNMSGDNEQEFFVDGLT